MKKKGLLPKLALNGILKNRSTYLPYLGISIFAIFTFFVFDLILNNEVMSTLPRAAYAQMLMMIGFILLGIIMIPFLYYTNSFLIKRRKKELGLYSILGMEKKHIGIMMLIETVMIYVIVTVCAITMGLIFSKLLFLLLLNLAKLPVDIAFSISGKAICDTLIFYAGISSINLIANLIQVGKANPVDLMSEAKKGEKEPKHIAIWTFAGILLLGLGYDLAITSKVDSTIFTNFFFAVFLVVVGTHFLFTSGSIALLRMLKKNKKFYYHSENFVSLSGMIYRMKKNAASLVNICIFATMTVITLICTISLYLGIPGVQKFMYPYDVRVEFDDNTFTDRDNWKEKLTGLAEEENVTLTGENVYAYVQLHIAQKGNRIVTNDGMDSSAVQYKMKLLTLDSFNSMEAGNYELGNDEILIYSTGADYGLDSIVFLNNTYQVREEIKQSLLNPKASQNVFNAMYYVIVPDYEVMSQIAKAYGSDLTKDLYYSARYHLEGTEEEKVSFMEKALELSKGYRGFLSYDDYVADKKDMEAMYGGLLFIGIFFGSIFLMCLLIIMYYKQITEGFEDQKSFDIMQKVGMSDVEVKRTIKKQVLQVFFIPLVGAILHTAMGMFMVINLMVLLNFFQTTLILICSIVVCLVFSIIYGLCYNSTAKAYYKIVKRMA